MNRQQQNGAYPLKEEQVAGLLLHAKSPKERLIIRFMAHAGLRRGEVISLGIVDLFLDDNLLLISGKNDKLRSVPISEEFSQEIKFYIGPRQTGLVFPGVESSGQFQVMSKSTINKMLARIGNDSGIENPAPGLKNINPHCLRHTYARHLKDKGVSIEAIQNVMGHSSFKTTMDVYGLMSVGDIQKEFRDKL